jgi:DNA ligase-1
VKRDTRLLLESMDRFAAVCEEIASHTSRLRKLGFLAEFLQSLEDREFFLAVQFLSTGPAFEPTSELTLFPRGDSSKLSVGGATLRDALLAACAWDSETIRTCHGEVGDTGELIGLLMRGHSSEAAMSLAMANDLYSELFAARTTARKREILRQAFGTYRPATIKYFVKVITRGLRIGLMGRMVEEAVAQACGVPNSAVRDANNRFGNLATVALAARHGTLATIEAALFHPMDFMLAKPLDRLEDLASPADWVVEDKFDGIRSQVHFEGSRVQIFSRGMEEITAAFPEVVKAFSTLGGNGILDGEILAWRNDRALSFNLLQQRLARKRVRATLLEEVPVVFIAYDLLLRDSVLQLATPFEERRAMLEKCVANAPEILRLSAQHAVNSGAEIESLFTAARERGNEGLVLKRRGSVYEPARRSGAWLKLKRPYGTLDVVITAAEQGDGRRAIYLSDYTFAVRANGSFVNVGKAYSGLTDSEVKELTRLLRSITTERFGRVALVKPEVVLEVAFDGVQKSPRHKSGYALRFPRILRWRRDKKPEDSDDLARVETLYQESLR